MRIIQMVQLKRSFFATAILLAVSMTAHGVEPDQHATLSKIAQASEKTSDNTTPTPLAQTDLDEIANLLLSAFAALGTVLTWQAIRRETKQQQIKRTFQAKILSDLIRHMYRNKVCICATHWKLKNEGFDSHYPSEEHLLKLKLLPEDLRFDRFDNTPDFYDILHELELKFRNFDVEVDVVLTHLKQPGIDKETKERDLKVLEYKSQLLTSEIINLMHTLELPITKEDDKSSGKNALPYKPMKPYKDEEEELRNKFHPDIPTEYLEDVRKYIISKYARNTKQHQEDLPSTPYQPDLNNERSNYFDKVLQLSEYLDNDIRGEYPKIHLIHF